MRKKLLYVFFILIVILLIGIALIEKPKNIKISAYTYPYSIVSSVNDEDIIDIKLFHIDYNSYFLDKDKIKYAYISGDEGKIKLIIDSIEVSKDNIEIKEDKYNYIHYFFKIDFKTSDEYELCIKKAYLEIGFSNDKDANIHIGSFSYYKYSEDNQDISITSLKAITKKDKANDAFYGFIIGIRNNSNKDINLTSIELLDINIKSIDIVRIDNDDKLSYDEYFNDESIYLDNVILSKNSYSYYACKINYNDYDLDVKLSSIGLRIKYNNNALYMEKFMFYKENITKVDTNNLIVYEYAK